MPKKIRVKDLKRDEVATSVMEATGTAYSFVDAHRVPLMAGVGGLAVIGLVVGGITWNLRRQELAASALYGEASQVMSKARDAANAPPDKAASPPADTATWEQAAAGFKKVADQYPTTTAGTLAAYEAAVADLRRGQAGPAAQSLSAFVDKHPNHWAAPHALASLAVAQEETGDTAAAEKTLVRLRDGDWQSYPPGAAMALLAQFYERHDRPADATKLWTQLSKDDRFAGTPFATQAKSKVQADASPAGAVSLDSNSIHL
jgi:TolA-binding protein